MIYILDAYWLPILAVSIFALFIGAQIQLGRDRTIKGKAAGIRETAAGIKEEMDSISEELADVVSRNYLVQSCGRCHEAFMILTSVSSTGRSIQYQCSDCAKKMHAAAATPEANISVDLYNRYNCLGLDAETCAIEEEILFLTAESELTSFTVSPIYFFAPESPLPFEQTKREHITEAVRSEVWRRDGAKCVKCGSNQQLEFDHVIPVSKGGATSVKNLQLLCKGCNLSKGAKI